jgi:hypothetical protein
MLSFRFRKEIRICGTGIYAIMAYSMFSVMTEFMVRMLVAQHRYIRHNGLEYVENTVG